MATKPVVIGGSTVSARQLKELFRQIDERSIGGRAMQAILDHQNPFDLPYGGLEGEYLNQCKGWESFYWNHFRIRIDFSKIRIPVRTLEQMREFIRSLVIAQGLTNNQVYDACQKHFPCSRYTEDLDKGVPTSERDPKNGSYFIWVRDTVEADEVHKNKSANMIRTEGLKTETLLERMIHELKYFLETGKHLDVANWTLCSGSRNSGGDVPGAYWYGGKFRVDWGCTGGRGDGLRSREAIV